MKQCSSCRSLKTLDDFTNCKASKDGKYYSCRSCVKQQRKNWKDRNKTVRFKEWRKKNHAAHLAMTRKWKLLNLERVYAYNHARRSKLINAGTYTEEEWTERKREYGFRCAYCRKRKKLTRHHVVAISRNGINTIDNIVPACRRCNSSIGIKLVYPREIMHEKRGVVTDETPEQPEVEKRGEAVFKPRKLPPLKVDPTVEIDRCVPSDPAFKKWLEEQKNASSP